MSTARKYFLTSAVSGKDDDPAMTISTMGIDREGDRVVPEGGDFSKYLKNPVLVWSHDYQNIPIGSVTQLEVIPGDGVRAKWKWLENDPFADRIKNAWDQGVVRASSIGFIAHDTMPNETGGRDIGSWEMLELSLCAIPMNPEAVRAIKSLEAAIDPRSSKEPFKAKPKKSPSVERLKAHLTTVKQYVDSYAQRAEYDETPDIQGVTAAINLLQSVAAHELAEEEAHASLIRDAVTLLITFLSQEFSEQFGDLEAAQDPKQGLTPPLSTQRPPTDANAGADKDEPSVEMDPDDYPYVSVTGIGDGYLVAKGVFERFIKSRMPKGTMKQLHDAHAHIKAASEHVNDVLTSAGRMSDNQQTDKPAESRQPSKAVDDIGLDAIVITESDVELDPDMVRSVLQALVPGLIKDELARMTETAFNRARGRLN